MNEEEAAAKARTIMLAGCKRYGPDFNRMQKQVNELLRGIPVNCFNLDTEIYFWMVCNIVSQLRRVKKEA